MKRAIELLEDYYCVDLNKRTRDYKHARARQIYFYCMRRNTKISLSKLAKSVGLKNHATALHGYKVIKNELLYDKELKKDIEYLEPLIKVFYKPNRVDFDFEDIDKNIVIDFLSDNGIYTSTEDENFGSRLLPMHLVVNLLIAYRKKIKESI